MEHTPSTFWPFLKKTHPAVSYEEQGPISIHFENLGVSYPHNPVISNLTCHFDAPAMWAIAGPNGAGKSNVSDALCFVLGRLSSKSMRAENLSKLIYNGGKKGNPAKEAYVSITFDNENNTFSIPLNTGNSNIF